MVANLYREHCTRERHKLYKNGPATPASWLHINKQPVRLDVFAVADTVADDFFEKIHTVAAGHCSD